MHFDRDLSLLSFHSRVLAQAQDESLPLLERLKFLCIFSSNLDEFFEIHVASLKEKSHAGISTNDLLNQISVQAHSLVQEQYALLSNTLLPALAQTGVNIFQQENWTAKHIDWVAKYFEQDLLPVLSPIGLDPAHPFPQILNKSLHFMVSLQGKDAFGRDIDMAIVPAPKSLPRFVRVPKAYAETEYEFISLASIIHANLGTLFPDMTVTTSHQFRVTRNSNLFIDDEEVDDLLVSLEGELPSRRYGDAIRLEVEKNFPRESVLFLQNHFNLGAEDVYSVAGPVNLNRLMTLYETVDKPELKYSSFTPHHPVITFESIQKNDLLLLHPFESFASISDLIKQAAHDPAVLVIKQTLYRTGHDSVIVDYLVEAANLGKEVTVVIELRARFDEEANIKLAGRLQEAGAHVVYGIVGYKTHVKMLLMVRKEDNILRRYVHLGTGNYHQKTSRQYVDYSFLTCDPKIGEDVHNLFMQLTGLSKIGEFSKCLEAPFSIRRSFLEKIKRETKHIKAKMNALGDPEIMDALEQAAQRGVLVDLIVRGICCLQPQKNLRIRSVLGRFLEHDRVYYFDNNGHPELYLSSADLMTRNLSGRIELAFPIENPALQKRIMHEAFELYWADNAQSFDLQADGSYVRPTRTSPPVLAQEKLLVAITTKA
ncbi:MAG: polyphosphate kinase 1 [Myxococcaceae bacterium]